MRLGGFTIVSNARRLELPIEAVVRSLLAVCDEVIVNIGPPDDGTRDFLLSLRDPRLRIIQGDWNPAQRGGMLATETQRALDSLGSEWALYLQADEVLHEDDIPALRAAIAVAHPNPSLDGLALSYLHFYAGFSRIATSHAWYQREVRVVRMGRGVLSDRDAQGFRLGPERRHLRATAVGVRVFHYGWARRLVALNSKRTLDRVLYHGPGAAKRAELVALPEAVGLRPFSGTHPAVAVEWITAQSADPHPPLAARPSNLRQLKLWLLHQWERLTGRPWFRRRTYTPS